jgi:hypothetical protein
MITEGLEDPERDLERERELPVCCLGEGPRGCIRVGVSPALLCLGQGSQRRTGTGTGMGPA